MLSPLDLLAYNPADAVAVQRAFGGMLIARNESAATAVAVRYGLACVDLEGTVSRPGSLQVRCPISYTLGVSGNNTLVAIRASWHDGCLCLWIMRCMCMQGGWQARSGHASNASKILEIGVLKASSRCGAYMCESLVL